jgi:hypothetical protein
MKLPFWRSLVPWGRNGAQGPGITDSGVVIVNRHAIDAVAGNIENCRGGGLRHEVLVPEGPRRAGRTGLTCLTLKRTVTALTRWHVRAFEGT